MNLKLLQNRILQEMMSLYFVIQGRFFYYSEYDNKFFCCFETIKIMLNSCTPGVKIKTSEARSKNMFRTQISKPPLSTGEKACTVVRKVLRSTFRSWIVENLNRPSKLFLTNHIFMTKRPSLFNVPRIYSSCAPGIKQ